MMEYLGFGMSTVNTCSTSFGGVSLFFLGIFHKIFVGCDFDF